MSAWSFADRAIRAACVALAERLPSPTVYRGRAGRYLTRWPLVDRGRNASRLCLHFFHRSDEDQELHTHPWAWAVAIQLAGGYWETRRDAGSLWVRVLRRGPGSVVFLRPDTAHRVELLDRERGSWSVILTGPITQSWGFYERRAWRFTPWRDFILAKGIEPRSST